MEAINSGVVSLGLSGFDGFAGCALAGAALTDFLVVGKIAIPYKTVAVRQVKLYRGLTPGLIAMPPLDHPMETPLRGSVSLLRDPQHAVPAQAIPYLIEIHCQIGKFIRRQTTRHRTLGSLHRPINQ